MRKRLNFNSRAEWLEARKEGIGASEVGTILGLNPYETPYQLWRRKIGLDDPKPMSDAMATGHILEDGVATWWATQTEREVIGASKGDFMFVDTDKPYMRVSPDRTFWIPGMAHNDDNKGILECKTTRMDVDPDDVPMTWFAQLQMNLLVSGYEHGSLAWLQAGMGFKFGYRDFTRDDEFCRYMEEEVTRFWIDNIVGKQEPLLQNVDDVLLRNPRHTVGKSVVADLQLAEECRELKEVKENLAALDTRKKELEANIKMAMGDAEALVAPAEGFAKPQILATWKSAKPSRRFDEKRFAQDMPDTYAEYQYEQPGSRRFLLK